jgi:hypothetical protein
VGYRNWNCKGRLTETVIRRAIGQIQRDLRNKELKFTAKERMALHKRVETLQAELKEVEIARLQAAIAREENAAQIAPGPANPKP